MWSKTGLPSLFDTPNSLKPKSDPKGNSKKKTLIVETEEFVGQTVISVAPVTIK